MIVEKLRKALIVGENICVEFKRCGNGIESDTYETVCSFLNRFGGDIYLGVENDGTVRGVPEKSATEMIKNFINMISNPDVISPTVYLAPVIFEYEGKTVIYIRVPTSPEVHNYKKVVFDRIGDVDIRVKGTHQIAEMYIRKYDIFTERRVYKYVTEGDLRFDLISKIRQMAVNRMINHPWKVMNDVEILKSAGLHGEDKATGERGYILAAVMLLGKDDVIRSIVPAYRTDALLRKVNVDRYDDRLIAQTNLIESYDLLMGFAEKHLPDKFYLEDDARISLRNVISREMLVNTLMHREFTSSFIAKFIIEKDRMFTENANRAASADPLTPDDYEPNPKNPIVASFFRNIGLADELGSGVRRLFKYGRRYSGKNPQLFDGDVFRTIVPLDDNYSFDAGIGESESKTSKPQNLKTPKPQNPETSKPQNPKTPKPQKEKDRALIEALLIEFINENPQITQREIIEISGKSKRAIQEGFAILQEKGILRREGSKRKPTWIVKSKEI